jgi:IS5 family transposase
VTAEARQQIEDLQTAYRLVFGAQTPEALRVVADMRLFCRADASAFHPDARVHALLEGRREWWLHVDKYMNLDTDVLYERWLKKNEKV